jgi:branched-chain amino acid transport system ATP-binding protein
MLEVSNLSVFYGKIKVVNDVSFQVRKGEIVALLGNNGAGKTTILNAVSGLIRSASGSTRFLNKEISQLPAYEVVKLGLSLVREGGKPFTEMTVHENLEMGAYAPEPWKRKDETVKKVQGFFPLLKERAQQLARTLSGGERQMLGMGRSLMSAPTLCMFDEPSYGLAPIMVKELFKYIQALNEQGITILVVEQNIRHALEVAHRAYVLENGRIVLEGKSSELIENDHIQKVYLGL